MAAINAAEQAAEAIRHLNHETIQDGALTPIEVYYVLGDVVSLLQRLPQALSQLHRQVTHYPGGVGADDTASSVEVVLYNLEVAIQVADGLVTSAAGQVSKAHQAASHLYGLDPEGE